MFYNLNNKWLWLLFSAIFYSLPYLQVKYFWFLIFFMFVPLYYVVSKYKVSFKDGFIWTLITTGLHLSGFYYSVIVDYDSTLFNNRLFLVIFFSLILSLFGGLWFWFNTKILNILNVQKKYLIILFWAFSSCVWVFLFDLAFKLFVTNSFGLIYHYHLTPLALYPIFLYPVLFIGVLVIPLIFLISAIFTILLLFNLYAFICSLFCASLFIFYFAFLPNTKEPSPLWLEQIMHLPLCSEKIYDAQKKDLDELANTIQEYLKTIIKKDKQIGLIVIPESAFYCDFTKNLNVVAQWSKVKIGKELYIISGGECCENNNLFNSIYLFYDGKIKDRYDKRQIIDFYEGDSLNWLDKTNVAKKNSNNQRHSFEILGNFFVPYICSELFFNKNNDDNFLHLPIIALCSDRWVKSVQVRIILFLLARIKAILWKRQIIYISYNDAIFIDKLGNVKSIKSIT